MSDAQATSPHDDIAAIKARFEAGYTLPADTARLQDDMRELLDHARGMADLLFQIAGWCQEADAGEVDDGIALMQIAELTDGWGE